jgi:hypothetical protein
VSKSCDLEGCPRPAVITIQVIAGRGVDDPCVVAHLNPEATDQGQPFCKEHSVPQVDFLVGLMAG